MKIMIEKLGNVSTKEPHQDDLHRTIATLQAALGLERQVSEHAKAQLAASEKARDEAEKG